jgi:hypothetical protein
MADLPRPGEDARNRDVACGFEPPQPMIVIVSDVSAMIAFSQAPVDARLTPATQPATPRQAPVYECGSKAGHCQRIMRSSQGVSARGADVDMAQPLQLRTSFYAFCAKA